MFTRLFVWDVDMRRDLQKGDAVGVVWRRGADGFPEVGSDAAQIEKTGLNALKESFGILATCVKEAPEFASRRRHAKGA